MLRNGEIGYGRNFLKKREISEIGADIREVHDLGDHILLFQGQFDKQFCEECIDVFEDADRAGMTVTRQNSNLSLIHI